MSDEGKKAGARPAGLSSGIAMREWRGCSESPSTHAGIFQAEVDLARRLSGHIPPDTHPEDAYREGFEDGLEEGAGDRPITFGPPTGLSKTFSNAEASAVPARGRRLKDILDVVDEYVERCRVGEKLGVEDLEELRRRVRG